VPERRTEEESAAESDVEAPVDGARFDFGRIWRFAAYALLAAAAVLLFLRRFEAAFLVAGLGAAAWFLHVRTTLIRKHDLVKVGGRDWRPRREVKEDVEEDDEE
jgi:hypothetical protein